jgi:hypothetical protein
MTTEIKSNRTKRALRIARTVLLFAILYVVSVGPVFKLYCEQKLPSAIYHLYKPVTSVHSPVRAAVFWYLNQWVG